MSTTTAPQPEPEVTAAAEQQPCAQPKYVLYVFSDVRLVLLPRLVDNELPTYRTVLVGEDGTVLGDDYTSPDEEQALQGAWSRHLSTTTGALMHGGRAGSKPRFNPDLVTVVRGYPPREILLEADSQCHWTHPQPRTLDDTLEEMDERIQAAELGLQQMRRHFCAYADADAAQKLFRRARRGRRALADLAGLLHSRFGGPFR